MTLRQLVDKYSISEYDIEDGSILLSDATYSADELLLLASAIQSGAFEAVFAEMRLERWFERFDAADFLWWHGPRRRSRPLGLVELSSTIAKHYGPEMMRQLYEPIPLWSAFQSAKTYPIRYQKLGKDA